MGLAQFENLDSYIGKKLVVACRYAKDLKSIAGLQLPQEAPWAKSIWWLYTVLVDRKKYGMDSRALMKVFEAQKIQARPFWHPLHSLKAFAGCDAYKIEKSTAFYRDGLSLPSSIGLS